MCIKWGIVRKLALKVCHAVRAHVLIVQLRTEDYYNRVRESVNAGKVLAVLTNNLRFSFSRILSYIRFLRS